MLRQKAHSTLWFAALLLALFPVAVTGMTQSPKRVIGDNTQAPDSSLHERVERLMEKTSGYFRAGKLLVECAESLPAGDLHSLEDRLKAGNLFYYAGKKAQAQAAFTRVAEEALAVGYIAYAADVYIRAGITALERRMRGEAADLLQKGRALAASPHLTLAEKAAINRWFSSSVAAGTARARQPM